jgi:Wiskott-Aldrich syndrome protein
MDGELDDVAMIVDSEMMRSPSPLERKTPPPRPSTPPLPLSPISNPSSPSRKRARTEHWKSPSHIPAFLPPFPSIAADSSTSIPPSPRDPQLPEAQSTELMPPPPDPKPVVPVTQAMTASAASDYLVQVPYSQSSLSSVPEWHLPTLPPSSSKAQQQPRKQLALPTLQTEPALFKAYHHVLTHRPSNTPPPSTLSRHKVAMAFLSQTQNNPRWDSADTLFSTVAPCPPRVAVIGPSYPVTIADPINVKIDPKDKDFRFPPTIPRPVSTTERLTPLLGQQSNRVPELSRHVLPVSPVIKVASILFN